MPKNFVNRPVFCYLPMLLKLVVKISRLRACACLFAGFCLLVAQATSQAGVVSSLTQSNLMMALTNGGPVTFLTDGTLTLTSTVQIATDTVIDGVGRAVTISGGGRSNNLNGVRIFFVTNNVTLTLRNLTVANGRSTNGAAIYNAGGLVNISNCLLAVNLALGKVPLDGVNGGIGGNGTSGGTGAPAFGGGIYNLGTVSIIKSILFGNGAFGSNGGDGGKGGDDSAFGGDGGNGGGGGFAAGGAIYNLGNVSISNSTFQINSAAGGDGGLPGSGGTAPFPGKPGNGGIGGAGYGGSIYNLGNVTVNNSTFVTNKAFGASTAHAGPDRDGGNGGFGYGGGIYNLGFVTVTNSTFTENIVRGGKGGDVFQGNFIFAGDGGPARGGAIFNSNSVVLVSCTIATNNAIGGAGGISSFVDNKGSTGVSQGGNIYQQNPGQVQMHNTILAKGTNGSNYAGTVIDDGYNLSSDTTPVFTAGSGSRNNLNARLASLANNVAGISPTMALLSGSAAIDNGDPSFCLAIDQRGVARPQGNACDIGAFEFVATFGIAGRLMDGTNGVRGSPVVASGPVTNSVNSATNGNYSISNLVVGSYSVTAGPSYSPSNYVVTLGAGSNFTNLNFSFIGSMLSFPSFSTNANGFFSFLVTGKPTQNTNQSYTLQRSTNLVDWSNFQTNINVTNGILPISGTNAFGFSQQFFRVLTP